MAFNGVLSLNRRIINILEVISEISAAGVVIVISNAILLEIACSLWATFVLIV